MFSDHVTLNIHVFQERIHTDLLFMPTEFSTVFLQSIQQDSFIYNSKLGMFIERDQLAIIENQKLRAMQREMNEKILQRFADFKSAAKLVELIQKIPNFRIKLTEQERDAIGQDGNVMVIGRSGTGKVNDK